MNMLLLFVCFVCLCVVDGTIADVGGQTIYDSSLPPDVQYSNVNDLDLDDDDDDDNNNNNNNASVVYGSMSAVKPVVYDQGFA
jgi:hypothetical protein